MSKVKFLSVFMLTVLFFSVGLSAAMAQQPPGRPPEEKPLLIRPDEVAVFGKVDVLMAEGSVTGREMRDPFSGVPWEEGRSAALLVTSQKSGEFVALIGNAYFKFSSPQAAQVALETLSDPIKDWAWKSATKDQASILDSDLAKLWSERAWRMWQGTDEESMPVYVLWIQSGSYITEVCLNILQEPLGRQLFNHIIRVLVSEQRRQPSSKTPTEGRSVFSRAASHGPNWWGAGVRASYFEYVTSPCCHVLAVWQHLYGYSPHFHGAGGDATTCNSNHGCISQWTWWLQTPLSKLGVPKEWWGTNFQNGSGSPNNYSATVWIN